MTGYRECGCVPGHRSTHIDHRCIVCGFSDADLEDGKPIPPCTDPDLGRIGRGHVCKHGVRWPHPCDPCDEAAYQQEQARKS